MTINVIKLLTAIGYSNPKATATKLFGSYTCPIDQALTIVQTQAKRAGKYQSGYAKYATTDLTEFATTETNTGLPFIPDEPTTKSTFVSDGSPHIAKIRHLVYDNIFVKLAEDKTNGEENAKLLIKYLKELQDSKC